MYMYMYFKDAFICCSVCACAYLQYLFLITCTSNIFQCKTQCKMMGRIILYLLHVDFFEGKHIALQVNVMLE